MRTFKVEYEIAQFYMNVLSAYFNSAAEDINKDVVVNLIKNDDRLSSFFNTYSWNISLPDMVIAIKKTFDNMTKGVRKNSYGWFLKYWTLAVEFQYSLSFI